MPSGLKVCRDCSAEKSLDEFHPHGSTRDRLRPECKDCRSARSKERYRPDEFQQYMRKRLYGLSREDYDALLARQGGVCAVCRRPSDRMHVDHDHACCPTNRHQRKTCGRCVRGLLCSNCNTALGLLGESVATLRSAAEYLSSAAGACPVD